MFSGKGMKIVKWKNLTISRFHSGQCQASVTGISQTLVYTPPAQYWSLHCTYTAERVSLFLLLLLIPAGSVSPPAHFVSFTHGREKELIAHRRRKHSAPLSQNHESVSFCRARLWTSERNEQRTFPDDAVSWRRTVLLAKTHYILPTLQTKSSFFVLKVENIMMELTI